METANSIVNYILTNLEENENEVCDTIETITGVCKELLETRDGLVDVQFIMDNEMVATCSTHYALSNAFCYI